MVISFLKTEAILTGYLVVSIVLNTWWFKQCNYTKTFRTSLTELTWFIDLLFKQRKKDMKVKKKLKKTLTGSTSSFIFRRNKQVN